MAINEIIYDDSTLVATKLIDIATARQQVISNNLANSSTPGYIRKDLDFQKALSEQLGSGDVKGVMNIEPTMIEDRTESPRRDGNNISIVGELNQLMQNGVFFNLMTKAYTTKMNILRNSMKSSV